MTGDFQDRVAARLLGVDVDAAPTVVRGQFRRLVRAVHPDTAAAEGCVDLGRLAGARDRLLARADRRALEAGRLTELERNRRTDIVARDRRARARREEAARRRVERMRAVIDPAHVLHDAAVTAPRTTAACFGAPRRPVLSGDRVGRLVDVAG